MNHDAMNEYERAVMDLAEARAGVSRLEERVESLRNKLRGKSPEEKTDSDLNPRLRPVLEILRKTARVMTLEQIHQEASRRKVISKAGVRAQIMKLEEAGYVVRSGYGQYKAVR